MVVEVVAGACVVVGVVGAEVVVGDDVVVVVAGTIVPEHLSGGMQRELPLPKTQQTQPGAQATLTVFVARL